MLYKTSTVIIQKCENLSYRRDISINEYQSVICLEQMSDSVVVPRGIVEIGLPSMKNLRDAPVKDFSHEDEKVWWDRITLSYPLGDIKIKFVQSLKKNNRRSID